MHNKSCIKQMRISFFQHFMTSLIVTTPKKLIQFGKVVQISQLQQRDFGMIRVVEGCFSWTDTLPLSFVFALIIICEINHRAWYCPCRFHLCLCQHWGLEATNSQLCSGVGTSPSPGVLSFFSWLLTSVAHTSGDSSSSFDVSLLHLSVHMY